MTVKAAAFLVELGADFKYTPAEVLELLVDAMRRSDPEYVESHVGCEPCTDEDWDTALEAGEECLEALEEVEARHG